MIFVQQLPWQLHAVCRFLIVCGSISNVTCRERVDEVWFDGKMQNRAHRCASISRTALTFIYVLERPDGPGPAEAVVTLLHVLLFRTGQRKALFALWTRIAFAGIS